MKKHQPSPSQFIRWMALSLVISAFFVVTATSSAAAQPEAGSISGTVFRDFDNDGVMDGTEPGISGVTVTAVDNLGNTTTTTTGNAGTYTTAVLAGTSARIEFTLPTDGSLDFLSPSAAGGTTVQFVDISAGNATNINAGFLNPAQYSVTAPQIVAPRWTRGEPTTAPNSADPVVRGHTYLASGASVPLTDYATYQQVGTIFGLAYHAQSGVIFGSTYIRRGAAVGPDNTTGTIYKLSGTGAPSLFIDLTNIVSTGSNPHPNGAGTNWTVDSATYSQVGKVGLGDLEISDDGNTLYAVNLNERELVIIPLTYDSIGQPIAPTASDISTSIIPIPTNCDDTGIDPNEPDATDWRPFALKFFDDKLYVGGVCTAESMIDPLDPATATFAMVSPYLQYLDAHVYVFNPATSTFNTTPVLSVPLDYSKEAVNDGMLDTANDGEWLPWTSDWRPNWAGRTAGAIVANPQPILADIEFDGRGFMYLGFRDRFADQAYDSADPGPSNVATTNQRFGGDFLLACLNGSGNWQLESGAIAARGCTNGLTGEARTAPNPPSDDANTYSVAEFFHADQYLPDGGASALYHDETALGSLAMMYGSGELVATKYDVFEAFEGGTVVYDIDNGNRLRAVQFYEASTGFGKAGGMGDVELLGGTSPIEVGNRIWRDDDGDGIQDPNEPGIAGVTVGLYDSDGTVLNSATTDSSGHYYFTTSQRTGTVIAQINQSSDDAEQRTDTDAVSLVSTDTELGNNNNTLQPHAIGLRFNNLAIPSGATITSAYIQFATDGTVANIGDPAVFTIDGQAANNPGTFTTTANNVDGRARTTVGVQVSWSTPTWAGTQFNGSNQRTPNLSGIVQEIVNGTYGAWASGNSMAFIINSSAQHRNAESFDGDAIFAPVLIVNYTLPSLANYAPMSYQTGYELRIDPDQATLSGLSLTDADGDSSTSGDLRDSDGQSRSDGYVGVSFVTGGPGDNDHTFDFGFAPYVSLGDKVWNDEDNDGVYDEPVRVGDTVWYDLDSDGLQDSSEPGVLGVGVALHRSTDADCTATALAVDTTDSNGRYLFDNLPPGNYFVCFDLTTLPVGFTPTTANVGGDDTIDSDANTSTGQTAATGALTAGQQNTTLDMGIINNGSVAVGDRVWYDTNRDGIQDTTETMGVPGVQVSLYQNGQTCGVDDPLATTQTDNSGYYLFAGLPAGNYFVCFDLTSIPTGYQATTQDAGGNDTLDSDANATTGATASTGAMAANTANMTLDMGLHSISATTNSLGDKVWYDQNRDGDQDGTAEPGASGVQVELHLSGETCADTPLAITTTDSTGTYSFTGLPDGSYFVCFDLTTLPTGYEVTTANLGGDDTQDSDADQTTGQTPTVALAGGTSNTTLDMGLQRTDAGTVAVGDRVWLDADRDGVQDVGEPGFPGIQVELYLNGQTCGAAPQTAITLTDADGYYLFSGLPSGNYFVCFKPGTLPTGFEFTTADAGGNDTQDSDANTSTGATPSTGVMPVGTSNMTLDAGIRSTSATPVSVGDFVWYDQNGNGTQDAGEGGVSGVSVTLYDATTSRPIASTTTASNGSYLFAGLPSASYYVIFDLGSLPAGYAATTQNVGGDTADSDADTTTGQTAVTGVIAPGGSNLTLDMGIRPAGTVRVGDRVWYDLDEDGRQDEDEPGTPGVTVNLHLNGQTCDSTPLGTTITNLDGNYQFANLAAGSYFVCFDLTTIPDGYTTTLPNNQADDSVDSDPFNTSGQTSPTGNMSAGQVNLTLDMGLISTGNVSVGNYVWYDDNLDGLQDSTEAGVPGIEVQLYHNGLTCGVDMPAAVTSTDKIGAYLFSGLPSNSYFVCFDLTTLPAGYTVTTQNAGGDTIDSDANPTTGVTPATAVLPIGGSDLTLDMGIRPTIGGGQVAVGDRVWYDDDRNGTQDDDEAGVPGVTVELHTAGQTCADAPVATQTTDSSGNYLFNNQAPGNYFVCFDLTTIPSGYVVTGQDVSGNDGNDSDADRTTGQTGNTGAIPANTANLTLDMGIFAPLHEVPMSGVTIQIYASAQACDGASYLYQVTTDADGNYVFPSLPASDYYIHIPASNFGAGQALEYMISSTGNDPAPDPDANLSNTDDNGTAVTIGACTGGVSAPVTTLAINTEPTSDGTSDPNTPDSSHNLTVDFGMFEPLCIGDLVWFDADNSGTVNGSEYGLNGISMNLYQDVNGNGIFEPGGADGAAIASTTTAQVGGVDGSYNFCSLGKGSYFVHIPSTEFQAGDLLHLQSSSTANNDPETVSVEDDDNGTDSGSAVTNGIFTVAPVSLIIKTEPTADNNTNDNGLRDSSTNQMVDLSVTGAMDYGDLPASYNNTIFGENGPRHASDGLILGALWDADNDGQENTTAVGDDTADSNDDEDGALVPVGSGITWGDGTGHLDAIVAGGSGCLVGWTDYNGDGDFADDINDGVGTVSERMFVQFLGTGTTAVSFAAPRSSVGGGTFVYSTPLNMRYRLFPANDPLFTAMGLALDGNGCPTAANTTAQMATISIRAASGGEVEDYQQGFTPTAVTLTNLQAISPAPALLIFVGALLTLLAITTAVILRQKQLFSRAK